MKNLRAIFVRFARLGAFTIGGGLVMLGLVESEMRGTGRFSEEEISDMIVLSTAVPGPIATNLAFLAGKKLGGWGGAFVAVMGTLLAPFLCILLLSSAIVAYLEEPWMIAFFAGAMAGIVVIVARTLWNMVRTSVLIGWHQAAAFAATAILLLFFEMHPFLALGVGAAVSLLGERLPGAKKKSGSGEMS